MKELKVFDHKSLEARTTWAKYDFKATPFVCSAEDLQNQEDLAEYHSPINHIPNEELITQYAEELLNDQNIYAHTGSKRYSA